MKLKFNHSEFLKFIHSFYAIWYRYKPVGIFADRWVSMPAHAFKENILNLEEKKGYHREILFLMHKYIPSRRGLRIVILPVCTFIHIDQTEIVIEVKDVHV